MNNVVERTTLLNDYEATVVGIRENNVDKTRLFAIVIYIYPLSLKPLPFLHITGAKFSSGSIPRIVTIANGYALDGFLEASHMDVASTTKCSALCINSPQCLSMNYSREERVCELNSSTKYKQPNAFSGRSGFVYFEKVANPGGEI